MTADPINQLDDDRKQVTIKAITIPPVNLLLLALWVGGVRFVELESMLASNE